MSPGSPSEAFNKPSGDREMPIFNSTYCQQRLDRHGVPAELIDLGADVGHMDALPRILAEFDRS